MDWNFKLQAQDGFMDSFFERLGDLKNKLDFLNKS